MNFAGIVTGLMVVWPLALAIAQPAAAISYGRASVSDAEPANDIIAMLPNELLGAKAVRLPPDSLLVTYFPTRIGVDPMAGISASRTAARRSIADLHESARQSLHQSRIRRVAAEGIFTSPKMPGVTGAYGEYLAGSGYKHSWTIEDGTNRIAVIVTLFRLDQAALQRARDEVAAKVFGGAVVTIDKDKP